MNNEHAPANRSSETTQKIEESELWYETGENENGTMKAHS
jgi:hypothetical protein